MKFNVVLLTCLAYSLIFPASAVGATQPVMFVSSSISAERVTVAEIRNQLEQRFYGRMLAIELRNNNGLQVYEVRWLGPENQVAEFRLYASNGQLFWMRGINLYKLEREQHENFAG